eukprot:CAMPEP_0115552972 /NCGR_PEP_ID=MMETSP0271-20121206/96524_1 /TAXON_ID=71861 /ORGANISM="Scrippsiella trochoidea, Strain CCMP3099" /LENGTH=203 /DNA_ID=CAMNT_0002986625 /DNA_START=33 /DNA_END=641 /DNA_ORIENTATION=+
MVSARGSRPSLENGAAPAVCGHLPISGTACAAEAITPKRAEHGAEVRQPQGLTAALSARSAAERYIADLVGDCSAIADLFAGGSSCGSNDAAADNRFRSTRGAEPGPNCASAGVDASIDDAIEGNSGAADEGVHWPGQPQPAPPKFAAIVPPVLPFLGGSVSQQAPSGYGHGAGTGAVLGSYSHSLEARVSPSSDGPTVAGVD